MSSIGGVMSRQAPRSLSGVALRVGVALSGSLSLLLKKPAAAPIAASDSCFGVVAHLVQSGGACSSIASPVKIGGLSGY